MTHYSRPRFTKVLDVWIDAEPGNARLAWEALAAYGAPMKGISPESLAKPRNVLQIGVSTTRIDILTSVTGLDFEDCWPRRTEGKYQDVRVFYVSREDLIRNKVSVGRPQDLLDVRALETPGGRKPRGRRGRKSPAPPRGRTGRRER